MFELPFRQAQGQGRRPAGLALFVTGQIMQLNRPAGPGVGGKIEEPAILGRRRAGKPIEC